MSNKPATAYTTDRNTAQNQQNQPKRNSRKRVNAKPYPIKKNSKHTKKLAQLEFVISGLTHDGRGVAIYDGSDNITTDKTDISVKQGKKVFASFALPNERVKVQLTNIRKNFEEGDSIDVIGNPNPERQQPFCQHFGICGGCSLQHWQPDGQIAFKQSVLAEHLEHQANIKPDEWLPPIVGDRVGYRTKARLGVRYITKHKKVVLGFRERGSNRLTHIKACPILDIRVGTKLNSLTAMLGQLKSVAHITHIEVAVGQSFANMPDGKNPVAMIIRHVKPMPKTDVNSLVDFFEANNWQLLLQPKGINSIYRVCSHNTHGQVSGKLYYQIKAFALTYEFAPTDFTQVNLSVNEKMVAQACALLNLKEGERVLDLFSGLGNFSLPMATMVGGKDGKSGLVIGVEGSHQMTQRATHNAKLNALGNTQFYTQDLTQDLSKCDWANTAFDALLIDPPRSGAWEIMQYIPKFNAKRIVYVSCDPATLARDSKALIEQGYRLTHAGVMDMFCHTAHVESMLRFEKV